MKTTFNGNVVGCFDHNEAAGYADHLAHWLADNGIPTSAGDHCELGECPDGFPDPYLKENWLGCGVQHSIDTVDLLEN